MVGGDTAKDIESRIDELYQAPLADFVTARQTLAKSLTGDAARRVKALVKPTVVPWAANQIYWHARLAYDRVLKSGEKLRAAQLAALKGKSADIASAAAEHRKAIADAVRTATRFSAAGAPRPDPDQLSRLLEAASLATTLPEPHGRFTKPLQPAGFEVLAGLSIQPIKPSAVKAAPSVSGKPTARQLAEARAAEDAERKRQKAIADAEDALQRALASERRARDAWDDAKAVADRARRAVAELKGK